MGQQSQSQEPRSSRFRDLFYLPIVAPFIVGVTLSYVTGRLIIQITGIQFNIGLLVLVTLVILAVMGISFFLGMTYIMWAFVSLFTKQKPPLLHRIVANVSMVVMFPLWLKERKNTKPPSETFEQMMERFGKEQESKDTKQ